MKKLRAMRVAVPAILAGLLLASPVLAQEKEDESDVFQLGTVTFSVDVRGEKLDVNEQMETSVTRTDIERFESKDIGTALARMPGLSIVNPIGQRQHHTQQNFRYESGVVVRGFEASGNWGAVVPLFIDGIPVYTPYDFSMDMGRFTTGGISTISVSKGYSSVLYGPNALGGVINVVSQRPTKPLYGSFVLGTGTGDVSEANGIIGTLQDKWYAQAGWTYFNREFMRSADTYTGMDQALQEKDTDRRNYGTRDKKVEFKFGYIPNATDEYVVSYLKQTAVKGPKHDATNCSDTNPECWAEGYIHSFWEWLNWDRETISFVSNTKLGNFYMRPRVFYDKYDNSLFNFGGNYAQRPNTTSKYDDYAWGGSMEIGWNMAENNTLKGKFDYKFNQHKNPNIAGRGDGAFLGLDANLQEQVFFFAIEDTHRFNENWEVQAGLLYSRRQTTYVGEGLNIDRLNANYPTAGFDPKPTDIGSWDPEAVLLYHLSKNHTFHYSIAKKTRFPTMRDQYAFYTDENTYNRGACGPGSDPENPNPPCLLVTIPNPDLKPERALHHEIGWTGKFFSRLDIDLAWFYSGNKNMFNDRVRGSAAGDINPSNLLPIPNGPIDVTTYPGFAVYQPVNLSGDIRRQGFDLGIEYNITDRIIIGKSFSYLHSTNKDDAEWRPRTQPAYNGTLYASVGLNDWAALIPALDYQGRSRVDRLGDNRFNFHQGFALFNLKLSVTPPAHRNVSINVGVENMFNKDYRGWGTYNGLEQYPSAGRYLYANVRYKL